MGGKKQGQAQRTKNNARVSIIKNIVPILIQSYYYLSNNALRLHFGQSAIIKINFSHI